MRLLSVLSSSIVVVLCASAVSAQSTDSPSSESVPRLVTITGTFRPADGQRAGTFETVTVSLYAESEGGTPVWQERQTIAIDAQGHYSLVLGANSPDGIPAAVFGELAAQWMSTAFERAGEIEGPRRRVTSTPYAIRAADADTLGGLPASAYLRAPDTKRSATDTKSATAAKDVQANVVLAGTTNFLAKYVNGADVGNSGVFEAVGGAVGMGTTLPLDRLHVRYDNNTGQFTGYAVQNTNGGANAYSGMLFYDHTNVLTQFQGYNNSTHEYRINNIARVSPGGAFNGTINFMIGNTSRFFVGSNGGVGVGTTISVGPGLEVSNGLTGALVGTISASTWFNTPYGGTFVGRKSRGSQLGPTAVQNGDQIALFTGVGQASTHSGALGNGMSVNAVENYTDAAQGTALNFYTTKRGTNTPVSAVTIDDAGNVGIGTNAPGVPVEVSRIGISAVGVKSFTNGADGFAGFITEVARGTPAAPAAVQVGDSLGIFAGSGYGTTGFGEFTAGMNVVAAENWTDAARGTILAFFTTQLGADEGDGASMAIMPDGKVGIGTFTEIPTIADKLQVFGDIRVGTTGTNGCLKGFGGSPIAGTCSSDRRFKKDITAFDHVLDHFTALQPVHYSWRASEFPDRHFGDSRAYGLIAQDVEQVFPELVVTNEDGFKAVDYSELPLLTIQAVKELKSKVEELNTENGTLKQRLAELERQMSDLVAASRR